MKPATSLLPLSPVLDSPTGGGLHSNLVTVAVTGHENGKESSERQWELQE